MADQVQTKMTAAEFFKLPETNTPEELIDGELIVSPSPVPKHQKGIGKTYLLLSALQKIIGGEAYLSPIDVFLDDENIPQPDVLWIAPDGKCKVGDKYLIGAPDLIVEVLSPGTEKRDRGTKFLLYEKFGVREYWLIQPVEEYVEIFVLENGVFKRLGLFEPGQMFVSPVLSGQMIEVKALFED
jgi:Uma2 family endonuclease